MCRYNAKIEEYCAARLNEWRTSTISIHLEYLSQLDQEHHLKVLELEQKRESLHLETIQKAEIEHKVQLKRHELKDAIEVRLLITYDLWSSLFLKSAVHLKWLKK